MNGAGNIAALRVQEAMQGVQIRLREIESRTGLSFSSYMMRSQHLQSVGGRMAVSDKELDGMDGADDAVEVFEAPEGGAPAESAGGGGGMFGRLPRSDYDSLFAEAADRYGLNPSLLKAMCYAESGFRPTAVSGAGAMGLMQLMPYTAEALGVEDPFDPEQNVDGGARLITSLLDRFGGNTLMAVAAYNCGAYGVTSRGITDLSDAMQRALLPSETRGFLSNIEDYLSAAQALSVLDSPYVA